MSANSSSRSLALGSLRSMVPPLVLFSLITNLGVLVSPIFMMQVLDRVVPSGNLNTLVMLLAIALAALALTASVDFFRDLALGRAARWVDKEGSGLAVRDASPDNADRLRDVQTLRTFLAGSGAVAALNMPWVPLFLVALYLLHPAFLLLAVLIAGLLLGVKALGHFLTRDHRAQAEGAARAGGGIVANLQRNPLLAGMMAIRENLATRHRAALDARQAAEDRSAVADSGTGAVGNFLRTAAQIGALGAGAALVTMNELSAGAMIGASIIMAKTVVTIEQLGGSWANLKETHAAYRRLLGYEVQDTSLRTAVNDLSGDLKAENLLYPRGMGAAPRLDRISFTLKQGECLAIIGESASGKTTLLHALCGADPTPIGTVYLDETDIRTLDRATRDRAIGYLPQQATLFPGTIAENISRFAVDRDDDKVVAAARVAGVHGLISSLANAYETDMGKEGYLLSAGQIQRIALARAIYEQPRYLFLDEPNALLDGAGERQLYDALARLKEEGTTIVMVVHRAGIMGLADKVLAMERGRMIDYGPRAEILGRMSNGHRRLRLPVNSAAAQDLEDWVARQFVRDGDEGFRQRAVLIAHELYQFACTNGPNSANRFLTFEFKFVDDTTCSLHLSEPRRTQLDDKVKKVEAVVNSPGKEYSSLTKDEQSLATVLDLGEDFDLATSAKQSTYSITVRNGDAAAHTHH